MEKKERTTFIILIVVVIAIILIINYVKGDGNGDEKTMTCIAENSVLIVKEGCPACAYQKNILGEDLSKFSVINCAVEAEKCMALGVNHVPTWIINEEKYEGSQSIEQLKELTGC